MREIIELAPSHCPKKDCYFHEIEGEGCMAVVIGRLGRRCQTYPTSRMVSGRRGNEDDGAKVDDDLFSRCEDVRRAEGLSRSDLVRRALETYNLLHDVRLLTKFNRPVDNLGEPNAEGQTEPFKYHKTCESNIELEYE